jgi:predicted AAA+ superfamily ATPase
VRQLVRDSLVKEVLRQGASEPAAYALIDRVRRSLGSKLSWTSLAQDLGLPIGSERRGHFEATPVSVRSYVEFLAASYLLLIVYYWRPGMIGQDLSRDKKVYFADPLLHTIARDYAGGVGADLPELVENLVAVSLYRRCEPQSFQTNGFAEPSRLHVWSSRGGTEIDFVTGPRDDLQAVEVKYRRRVDRRQLAGARGSVGSRVIVATRSDLDLEGDTVMVPAHLLAWALG